MPTEQLPRVVIPSELKQPILASVHALLRPLGYRKNSALFRYSCGEVFHLIEIQSSRHNSASEAKFTVNVGVFAPDLLYPDERDACKPSIPSAHWKMRLGMLCPENKDLWWNVSTLTEALAVADDITGRIEQYALPALADIRYVSALQALWRSGRSPGLTARQRDELLSRLA